MPLEGPCDGPLVRLAPPTRGEPPLPARVSESWSLSVDMRHRSTPVRPHNGTRCAGQGSNRAASRAGRRELSCHTDGFPDLVFRIFFANPASSDWSTHRVACGQPFDPQHRWLLASAAPETSPRRILSLFTWPEASRAGGECASDLVKQGFQKGWAALSAAPYSRPERHAQPVDKGVDHPDRSGTWCSARRRA